jgi:hypothetical protein
MKNNKLFIVVAIAVIIAVGKFVYQKNTAVASQHQPTNAKTYIALETNSPEIAELSQNILYTLARRTQNQWTAVDMFVGEKVQNLYSQAARRRDLEELSEQVKAIPSSDQALIQSLQRFKDEVEQNKQQHVFGFIVTKGTANSTSLATIYQICQKLAQTHSTKAHIAIIGLSPENRLPMSTAISPLSRNVQFAGTDQQEWQQVIKF